MSEPTVDVLAVIRQMQANSSHFRNGLPALADHHEGEPQRELAAIAAVAELIEADREYDAANVALNQAEKDWSKKFDAAFATAEEWAPLNAAKTRVFVATTRRAAALSSVGGSNHE